MGPRQEDELIVRRFEHPVTKAIFKTFEEFRSAVLTERNLLTSHKQGRPLGIGSVVFTNWGSDFLTPGPHHDLQSILKRVLKHSAQFRDFPVVDWQGSIGWTKRIIKGWHAKAQWDIGAPKGSGVIRINILLDSPDVTENALEFLVFHEYLHLLLQIGHTPVFKRFEKKWPGILEAERELKTLNEQFELPYQW
jgi:hypothetical protein